MHTPEYRAPAAVTRVAATSPDFRSSASLGFRYSWAEAIREENDAVSIGTILEGTGVAALAGSRGGRARIDGRSAPAAAWERGGGVGLAA
ncbi:hypothetical protein [Pseudactinotalea sp. Z1732]|uniref:hypothetical protein n=1 Tax=Micrococcales TaxID=85006 RepID=UPI003C7C8432